MSLHLIKMPDIGEGIAEVELVAWHVKAGDRVALDQPLADVMTDKANVEIPSPVVGTVVALGGEVGQTLAVGSELIRIELASEGESKVRGEATAVSDATPAPPGTAAPPAPAASLVESPVEPAGDAKTGQGPGQRPIASPSVRRRARELELDLGVVRGSGPNGRIVQTDLDAAAEERGSDAPEAQVPLPAARGAERNGEQAIALIGLRRKIAEKMQEAKRRIPHFSYVEELDVTELESLRAVLNSRWSGQRGKLTLLPFIARAIVLAVREYPQINARFDDEAGIVTRHAAVHIGIAAQTEAGLLVPVLRHAEALDLWALAVEIARLGEAARSGKASRGELSGSTITITSLGALGGIATTPIINHPEVAIVGVNRIVERPVYRNGVLGPRLLMNLSSSFDHRVVDGIDAARFVQSLRNLLETPATLFIE
ncbi:MAG: 2-oxo acid dehydrogenase subunit E2 [Pseudomonadota bacterium]|nr:2-oxo acid dehydrogenase subunit E2 [Pseudomonadota bacterium]